MSSNPLYTYKVVVVGSSGVGKTAVVQRLIENVFNVDGQSTIGVEFKSHCVSFDDETVRLNIWDTAGQERFRSVSKAYFRNAVGAVLVFSLDSIETFNDLDSWINDLNKLSTPNAAIILIGNKCDLKNDRQVSESEALSFAERHHIEYLETSAKDNTNIGETFVRLSRKIHERVKRGEIQGTFQVPTAPPLDTRSFSTNNTTTNSTCSC